MSVWYGVRDLDAAGRFYTESLGFEELYRDDEGGWMRLARNGSELALAKSDEQTGAVLAVDVEDVKAEADRLRRDQVAIGVVFELHEEIRLLDVFDPDGNRIQLTQELSRG